MRYALALAALHLAAFSAPAAASDDEPLAYRDHPFWWFGEAEGRTADITLVDVDGDGDLDVIAANGRHWPEQDSVYLNSGNGRLLEARPVGTSQGASYTLQSADLNGDGLVDLVVVRDSLPAQIFLGDGDGHFSFSGEIADSAYSARSALLADVNGDGQPDLVVAIRRGPNRLYMGQDGASFGPPIALPGEGSTGLAIGDVDGDGDLDLVSASRDDRASSLLINDNGAFTQMALADSVGDHRKAVITDINGDGRPDIILASTDGALRLYFQRETVEAEMGGFGDPTVFQADGATLQALAAADLDGDGDMDLVAGTEEANQIYRNDGAGGFAVQTLDGEADTYGVAIADMNGDGRPDIVFANSGAPNQMLIGIASE